MVICSGEMRTDSVSDTIYVNVFKCCYAISPPPALNATGSLNLGRHLGARAGASYQRAQSMAPDAARLTTREYPAGAQ